MLHRALCVFAVCPILVALAAADDKPAGDAKEMQGTWQAVNIEANGEKSPDDQIKEMSIVISGGELAVKPDGEGRKCKFKLDAGKSPKTIDLVPHDGPRKGQTVVGIYSLKDGRLSLCINIFGEDPAKRPTEFKTRERDGVGLLTLERAKPSGERK